MPIVELKTNVKIDDVQGFVVQLSKRASEVLSKPEEFVNVLVSQDVPMSFGGKVDPAYSCTITTLGDIEPEAYSAGFSKFLEDALGVPSDRGYISILNPKASQLGWKGTTVGALFGIN